MVEMLDSESRFRVPCSCFLRWGSWSGLLGVGWAALRAAGGTYFPVGMAAVSAAVEGGEGSEAELKPLKVESSEISDSDFSPSSRSKSDSSSSEPVSSSEL